ncbi:glycerophosphodiester phosphodiesterase [Romboutsia maritimum]|uniref:Glycerophosphodiester phosphodiesterase n=1 Tax=Romboutsia maritimum TaxID=2020948 RepID=A0A371IW32_9FIRM|nr:glycerophosphodiester phosphodiesterase [Romboutsia maritimum]RDY24690.1 glycerophosphodiester phosphodiesterase [Romboutsia maritimum]
MNIYAHRGFSGYYPENTMLSFKKCLDLNICGIEFDVHKTKDEKLVVIHDETIDRTFNGCGLVQDYTLKELKNFKSSIEGFEDNDDCKIPTLEEVLELFLPTNFILNIELKTDNIHYKNIEKDVIDLINKYNIKNRIILSSFNPNSLKICNEIDSTINTGLLFEIYNNQILDLAKNLNANYIHPPVNLVTEHLLNTFYKNNFEVNVYTANSTEDMIKLINFKVNGIFTNYPDKLNNIKKKF